MSPRMSSQIYARRSKNEIAIQHNVLRMLIGELHETLPTIGTSSKYSKRDIQYFYHFLYVMGVISFQY